MEKEDIIWYSFSMDFSRPDNARLINRLKTLSAIREKKNMTRAELSRELLINKVSVSEIVDTLIKEGLVKESGKLTIDSGRPATLLDIDVRAGKVIGLVIREKGCLIAASDLKGKILRLERFPRGKTPDELKENLKSSLERILRNENVRIYGAVVVSDEDAEDIAASLPFECICIRETEAQVLAEQRRCSEELGGMLFLHISDEISAYYEGKELREFSHLRVGTDKACACGATGCIGAYFSGNAFKAEMERIYDKVLSAREILSCEEGRAMIEKNLKMLAISISLAAEVLGAKSAMLIGEYSNLEDEAYAHLNEMTISLLPSWKNDFVVYKSIAGDGGAIEGACHKALDHFFYKKQLLESLKVLELY